MIIPWEQLNQEELNRQAKKEASTQQHKTDPKQVQQQSGPIRAKYLDPQPKVEKKEYKPTPKWN